MGIMSDKGMELIPFVQWIWMVLPLAFVMLVVMSLLLSVGVSKHQIHKETIQHTLDVPQKKILFVLFGLILLLLLNAQMKPFWSGLGLSEPGILLAAGLVLFMPPFKILVWNDDAPKVPYQIIFLFGAGFSIAKAFGDTGLADALASYLLSMTDMSPIFLLLSVAVLITFTTEITSNTALISIMLPVIYSVSVQAEINSTLFMMVATVCASYAFMLPIATAPNAIAMSSGAVHIKDMIRYGIILNFIGIFFIVIIAEFFWKNIL